MGYQLIKEVDFKDYQQLQKYVDKLDSSLGSMNTLPNKVSPVAKKSKPIKRPNLMQTHIDDNSSTDEMVPTSNAPQPMTTSFL